MSNSAFFCYNKKELVSTIKIQLIYNNHDKKSISLKKSCNSQEVVLNLLLNINSFTRLKSGVSVLESKYVGKTEEAESGLK